MMQASRPTLQSIFRAEFPAYAATHRMPVRALRAASAIRACRTDQMGGHVLACPNGHTQQMRWHSCGHRSCPRCAHAARARWMKTQIERLLPCDHHHIVFTLPHELIALWEHNRSSLNHLLFQCARDSLIDLCRDPRFLGATPGILMNLHTWGRTLSHHPHVHCLVSAGGLGTDQRWHPARCSFLVPVRALKALWRGKLLHHLRHALEHRRLALPPQQPNAHWLRCIAALYRKNFNVHISARYSHGRGVLAYLARYAKGGPLHPERLISHRDHHVCFGYFDHRDTRPKRLRLDAHEFLERILYHAPPRGQHTVRHFGLYASRAQNQRQQCTEQLMSALTPARLRSSALGCDLPTPAPQPVCPDCRAPLRRVLSILPAHRIGEFAKTASALTTAGPTSRSTAHAQHRSVHSFATSRHRWAFSPLGVTVN